MIVDHISRVESACNSLPFVCWDRMTTSTIDNDEYICVYGWIARSDWQRDFVLLHSWFSWDNVEYRTSSAKYSKQIGEILYGVDSEHVECERVADRLGEIKNVVRSANLKEGDE